MLEVSFNVRTKHQARDLMDVEYGEPKEEPQRAHVLYDNERKAVHLIKYKGNTRWMFGVK